MLGNLLLGTNVPNDKWTVSLLQQNLYMYRPTSQLTKACLFDIAWSLKKHFHVIESVHLSFYQRIHCTRQMLAASWGEPGYIIM